MMREKTLLFLCAENFHACIWKGGALSGEQHFACDPDGREQFALFLQNHRAPAYLLTDLIEEDFRHETVPHLRGGERAALIRRKFEQYYRSTPFRQALPLRRQKDGRRDDDILFSGLTNPALILPWLNIMLAHPLAGIYSVPNISTPLIEDIPSGHLLLLSWEKHVGLRQTYFDAGLLRFSRLTPLDHDESFGETVATEVARTQQYLMSLSLLPQGQVLDAHIICHAHDRRELEARLKSNTDMQYTFLDIREMGKRIKSETCFEDSDATALFLHLLATRPPRSHYAATAHTHFFQLLQLRRSLLWLSATMAVCSIFWSVFNVMEGRWLNDESASLGIQAKNISKQQIMRGFPNTLANATDMKTTVLLARRLNNYSPPPQTILDGISKTLDIFTRIRIEKLSWQASFASDISDSVAKNSPAQVITLGGDLMGFSAGDYRNALDYLERFQQDLTRRGYEVTALALPLDISPKGSIATGLGDERVAMFSLQIIWKPTL